MYRTSCSALVALLVLSCNQAPKTDGSAPSVQSTGSNALPASIPAPAASAAPASPILSPSSSVAASVSASSTAMGKPLVPFAELKELRLHLEQGANAKRDCDGTIYKLSVDIEQSKWLLASCEADAADAKGPKTLKVKNGTITPTDRSAIEKRYAALTHLPPVKECGVDNVQLTLSLTKKDETSLSYVDTVWRCGASPEVVPGLDSFGSALELMVNPPVSQ